MKQPILIVVGAIVSGLLASPGLATVCGKVGVGANETYAALKQGQSLERVAATLRPFYPDLSREQIAELVTIGKLATSESNAERPKGRNGVGRSTGDID